MKFQKSKQKTGSSRNSLLISLQMLCSTAVLKVGNPQEKILRQYNCAEFATSQPFSQQVKHILQAIALRILYYKHTRVVRSYIFGSISLNTVVRGYL
jgi:hypothetical protein